MRHIEGGVSLRRGGRRLDGRDTLADNPVQREPAFPVPAHPDADVGAGEDMLPTRWGNEEQETEEEFEVERDVGVDAMQPGVSTPAAMYLREISRVPLLNAADEVSLAQAIERGKEALGNVGQPSDVCR